MVDTDKSLPVPVRGGVDPEPPPEKVVVDALASTAGDDQAAQQNSYNRTVRALASQDLVRIRIPPDGGPQFIRINGYSTWYQAGEVYMVPQQIAELLEESKRI